MYRLRAADKPFNVLSDWRVSPIRLTFDFEENTPDVLNLVPLYELRIDVGSNRNGTAHTFAKYHQKIDLTVAAQRTKYARDVARISDASLMARGRADARYEIEKAFATRINELVDTTPFDKDVQKGIEQMVAACFSEHDKNEMNQAANEEANVHVNVLNGLAAYTPLAHVVAGDHGADDDSLYGFTVTSEMTMSFMHSDCEFTRRKNELLRSAATMLVEPGKEFDETSLNPLDGKFKKCTDIRNKTSEGRKLYEAVIDGMYHFMRLPKKNSCTIECRPKDVYAFVVNQNTPLAAYAKTFYHETHLTLGNSIFETPASTSRTVQSFSNIVGTEPLASDQRLFPHTYSTPLHRDPWCTDDKAIDLQRACCTRIIKDLKLHGIQQNFLVGVDDPYTAGFIDYYTHAYGTYAEFEDDLVDGAENTTYKAQYLHKALLARSPPVNPPANNADEMPEAFPFGLYAPQAIFETVCKPTKHEYDGVAASQWLYLVPAASTSSEYDCIVDFDDSAGWCGGDAPTETLDAFSGVQSYISNVVNDMCSP